MPTTRLALIGAGTIGKTHIDRIQRHPALELAGIADPTAAGQALAEQLAALAISSAETARNCREKSIRDNALHETGGWPGSLASCRIVKFRASQWHALPARLPASPEVAQRRLRIRRLSDNASTYHRPIRHPAHHATRLHF